MTTTTDARPFPWWRLHDLLADETPGIGARVTAVTLLSGERIGEIRSLTTGPDWIAVSAGHGEGERELVLRTEAIAYVTLGPSEA